MSALLDLIRTHDAVDLVSIGAIFAGYIAALALSEWLIRATPDRFLDDENADMSAEYFDAPASPTEEPVKLKRQTKKAVKIPELLPWGTEQIEQRATPASHR
jgi:hypothetical protein